MSKTIILFSINCNQIVRDKVIGKYQEKKDWKKIKNQVKRQVDEIKKEKYNNMSNHITTRPFTNKLLIESSVLLFRIKHRKNFINTVFMRMTPVRM